MRFSFIQLDPSLLGRVFKHCLWWVGRYPTSDRASPSLLFPTRLFPPPCPPLRYSSETWSTEQGEVALGHVTNYAQNQDGMVWDLAMLEEHLGEALSLDHAA